MEFWMEYFGFLSPDHTQAFQLFEFEPKMIKRIEWFTGQCCGIPRCLCVISEWQQRDMHMRMIHALFAWPQSLCCPLFFVQKWMLCLLSTELEHNMTRRNHNNKSKRVGMEMKRKWRRLDRFCRFVKTKRRREENGVSVYAADLCCFQAETKGTKNESKPFDSWIHATMNNTQNSTTRNGIMS